jgi:predicted Zn-dependent peptidase
MGGVARRTWRCLFLLAIVAPLASAQDLTHPLDMDLPASKFVRPDPSDFEVDLPNGLVAYVAVADQVPLVTLSAFVRAGKVSDDVQGAAETLADALSKSGPATSTPAEFRMQLDRMTAEYRVDMHQEWTEVSLNVPSEDLDDALPLFAALLISPSVSASDIERVASRVESEGDNDLGGESGPALYEGSLTAAVQKFYEILYRDHPFGDRPGREDFEKLTPADESIETSIADLFGGMAAREAPTPREQPDIRPQRAAQHNFPIERLQSWLVFGHDLPQVPLEDQAALEVMNYILAGGHLWTRMTIETRYKYGYTNDASGFLEDRWFGPGGYTFRSYSRHEVIRNIYDNMMREIVKIQKEPVTDRELFVARGALADGSFQVRYLDGYAATRSLALEKLRFGNHDRSASYVQRIRAVTAEDVQAAANKYIRPQNMQVVLVGEEIELID